MQSISRLSSITLRSEFARRIVGWRVARDLSSNLVLDALEQALYARETNGLTHHSDRGSQYLAIRYSERLARAGVAASVGSRGDSAGPQ